MVINHIVIRLICFRANIRVDDLHEFELCNLHAMCAVSILYLKRPMTRNRRGKATNKIDGAQDSEKAQRHFRRNWRARVRGCLFISISNIWRDNTLITFSLKFRWNPLTHLFWFKRVIQLPTENDFKKKGTEARASNGHKFIYLRVSMCFTGRTSLGQVVQFIYFMI